MSTIHNELDYINGMAEREPEALIARSEERFRGIVVSAAEKTLATHGHKLLLLAGPSAAGKTTTARMLAERLGASGVQTHMISLDDFYLPAEEIPLLPGGARDIESIHALDLPLLRRVLHGLMTEGEGELPRFDFESGRRAAGKHLKLGLEDMIVLEGLHALNPLLGKALAEGGVAGEALTRIYINVSSRIYDSRRIVLHKRGLRLARRIARDIQFRNAGAAETIRMWPGVTAGEDSYLAPCKQYADLQINSVHVYEPCVFRERILPLLEAIAFDDPAAPEARRLIRSLRCFAPLPEALVPPDSLLREFLG
jgi:uridine kinase